MKICMVPVCYNAHSDAMRFLASVERAFSHAADLSLEVILADNSNIPAPTKLMDLVFSFSYSYVNNQNIGYFPAFNQALRTLVEGVEDYDYIIVCNVDLVVADDFFVTLVRKGFNDQVGVIAPGIFSDKDGRDLNPKMMRRPTYIKINFMRLVCSHVFLFRYYHKLVRLREHLRSRLQHKRQDSTRSHCAGRMYGAHGSFMIFTRRYFAEGAHVDYPRFLFGEEGFVAEQLRMHDLEIEHVPDLRIFDKEHASTSQVRLDFICAEHKKSYDYFYDNFLKNRH